MRTNARWTWIEPQATNGKTVHEREREPRVLYTPSGEKLVEVRPRIGFEMPKGERRP